MATISGNVIFDRDRRITLPSGDSGLSNIPVILQNVNTAERLTVLTNTSGQYSFLNVPNGNYRIVESYGAAGGIPTPGDFSAALIGDIPQGADPPIAAAPNPPPGSTNLDSLTPNTLLVTVAGADLTDRNFLDGPVIYTPIETILDSCAVISGENLVKVADDGTFGTFRQGSSANTGDPVEPYPEVTPDFDYVLPNPAVYSPAGGEYSVQNILNDALSARIGAWWRIADHTTGNETGRMMVVNGYNPGAIFFRENMTVVPNTNYLFTAWILNLFRVNGYPNPELGVRILDQNGEILYNETLGILIPPNPNAPEWKQIGSVIHSGSNTNLVIEFLSEGPEVVGNDYAIDDISFNEIQVPRFVPVKAVDRQLANVGETVRFTVTMTNTCQSPLTDLFFLDTIPDGFSFVAESVIVNGTPVLNADPNTGFALPDVGGGETVTISFVAVADAIPVPNPARNQASVNYSYTPVEGGIPVGFEVISNEVSVEVGGQADVSVVKAADPEPVDPGGVLKYTILIANSGPSPAENVVLTDSIPTFLSNVEFSTDGGSVWQSWPGVYGLGTLPAGSNRTVLIRGFVVPAASGSIFNTAVVSSDTPDPDLSNNSDTAVTLVTAQADLSVIKLGSPKPAVPGEPLLYTLVVSNAGPAAADEAVLADTMPAELMNSEFSTDNGITYQPWNGSLLLGRLPPGSEQIVLIRGLVTPSASETITNTATVNSVTPDPDLSNNRSTDDTTVAVSADLMVTKTGSPSPVPAGGQITYTLLVFNAGPSEAENVVLHDSLPAGLSSAEISIDNGVNWTPFDGAYFIGVLAAGASVTFLIRASVSSSLTGNLVNTTTVESDTPDPDPDNNTSTYVTPVAPVASSADLSVVKTGSPNPIQSGELLTYAILVANAGPSDAENAVLTDAVPPALTNVQFSLNGGVTWQAWTGSYHLGTLPADSSRNVLIRGIAGASAGAEIVNTAVVGSDTPDPDPSNNSSVVTITLGMSADLSVNKSAQPIPVLPGSLQMYTVTVVNHGPDRAADVTLYDVVPLEPSGTVFSIDGGADWQPWNNSYSLGTLAAGESRTILIRGIVPAAARGTISNTAEVVSLTPDPNPANNTDTIHVPVRAGADLSIHKTVFPNPAIRCQCLTYTLTVCNAGPEPAQQVILSDNVPAELENVMFSMDSGKTWKPWNGTYVLGCLPAGACFCILLSGTVRPCADCVIHNTAAVASRVPDPNPFNNTASVSVGINDRCSCNAGRQNNCSG